MPVADDRSLWVVLRCGRMRCYFTGPFMILMGLASLLESENTRLSGSVYVDLHEERLDGKTINRSNGLLDRLS